jgi:hypothetical protein
MTGIAARSTKRAPASTTSRRIRKAVAPRCAIWRARQVRSLRVELYGTKKERGPRWGQRDRGNQTRVPPSKIRLVSKQALVQISVVEKSTAALLCVGISSWRGSHALELRKATSNVPGIFMSTPNGVYIDIAKVEALPEAICLAKKEAVARGLIESRSEDASCS